MANGAIKIMAYWHRGLKNYVLKIFTYWNDFDNGKEKKPLND
ncbi:hypothetical protein [Neobacillus drentensis]